MRPAFLALPLLALAACSQVPEPQTDARQEGPRATPNALPAPAGAAPVASVGAPAASPVPPTSVDSARLARADGYGDLRFGMDEAAVRAAWKSELKGDKVEADNCAYLRPKADGAFRIGFMFEGGTFVRYDVNIDGEAAPGGGRVGQQRAEIERLYAGRVQVQPHEYVPGGQYLRVADPAIRNGALVFEIDEKGRVTRWRLGRVPQVDYVEGCA